MIIDSSAIMAILRDEPERRHFAEVIAGEPVCRIAAGSYLEVAVVISRRGDPAMLADFDALMQLAEIEISPMTAGQAVLARQAFVRFGRGSGQLARLNFGDCFAYALAKELDEPLLFKGNDFSRTDVRPAIEVPS